MSRHHDQFTLQHSATDCLHAARAAILALGWRLANETPTVLTGVEIQHGLASGSPVQATITVSPLPDGSTQLTIDAGNFGFGPLQSHHIKTQVQALRQQIELAVRQAAESAPAAPGAVSRAVVVNGESVPDAQIQQFEEHYRVRIQDGLYWYDRATGAWGMEGGPTVGFILPNLGLGGPLREDASRGTTGVFINGRQLHQQDVLGLQQLVGMVLPGRWWVDAAGNIGLEGGPILGNLLVLAKARQGAGGAWSTHSSITGATVMSDGTNVYAMGKSPGGDYWSASTSG